MQVADLITSSSLFYESWFSLLFQLFQKMLNVFISKVFLITLNFSKNNENNCLLYIITKRFYNIFIQHLLQ